MARNKKKTSRQQAGEFVSGGDMDSSMFWFGDLNLWGAFPTVPTVYQKPRSQVFYMTRISAPDTHSTPAFTSYYGSNAKALGDPDGWLRINVGGTDYKVPLYS